MNVQKPEYIIDLLKEYMVLDTDVFERVSAHFLESKKRKTYDLMTQNGLRTLLELRADVTTLTAFLLFRMTVDQRPQFPLGEQINQLLESLDGLSAVTALGNAQVEQSPESVRKMLLAMSRDLRVVLVLMSLRYAELFGLGHQSPELRRRIAQQTLDIYVPITGRLGIYTLKRKLEDLCFSYLSPDDYLAMVKAFDQRPELHDVTVRKLVRQLKKFLSGQGIEAEVSGRVKGTYSTYMKLKRKGGGALDEIFDLLALRVVVPEQTDCYTVLSWVNNHWQPITGRFKDYIAMPKVNGYRSLHSTVLGMIDGSPRPVEIQIRTAEMHREAEYGIAAHWWYEEDGIKLQSDAEFVGKGDYQERLQWVQNLVHLQDSLEDERGHASLGLFTDRIFVMTLNGRVVELPSGSTPLDFAYHMSESLGHHCSKAKVNGQVVPLDYELKNGDRVFVVKKMDASPNLYWLSLVKTERARKAIRAWLLEQGEETVLDQGMRLVNAVLRRYHQPILDDDFSILKQYRGKELTVGERRALLIDIGQGKQEAEPVVRAVMAQQQLDEHERVTFSPLKHQSQEGVVIAGEKGYKTKLAACCHPEQPLQIVGYVTRGGFISVHLKNCKVLASLDRRRFIQASWTGQMQHAPDVGIEVHVSMAHLLTPLSESLQQHDGVLRGFSYHEVADGFVMDFELQFPSEKDLQALVAHWQTMKGVDQLHVRDARDLVLPA